LGNENCQKEKSHLPQANVENVKNAARFFFIPFFFFRFFALLNFQLISNFLTFVSVSAFLLTFALYENENENKFKIRLTL